MTPATTKMRAFIWWPESCFLNVIKCGRSGGTVPLPLHVWTADGNRALSVELYFGAVQAGNSLRSSSCKGCGGTGWAVCVTRTEPVTHDVILGESRLTLAHPEQSLLNGCCKSLPHTSVHWKNADSVQFLCRRKLKIDAGQQLVLTLFQISFYTWGST